MTKKGMTEAKRRVAGASAIPQALTKYRAKEWKVVGATAAGLSAWTAVEACSGVPAETVSGGEQPNGRN